GPCRRGGRGGWGLAGGGGWRGRGGRLTRLRPRRARCRSCRVTHVLLAVLALVRRADTVEVIGAALVAAARGGGFRSVAAGLGLPPSTVRGWLRRFCGRVGPVRVFFTALAAAAGARAGVSGGAGAPPGGAGAGVVRAR